MTVHRTTIESLSSTYESIVKERIDGVGKEVLKRGCRASTYARDAVLKVLSGPRIGRHYGNHQASAPGEAPAVKTGLLRNSFETMPNVTKYGVSTMSVVSEVQSNTMKYEASNINYAWLDEGLGNIAPRPYLKKAQEEALDMLLKDLKRPYNV